jgi:hypothetical protein
MQLPTRPGRWLVAITAVFVLTASLGASLSGVAEAAATTVTSTTTALTLAQWKQRYEPVVGQLADDALAVVKAGTAKSGASASKRAAQVRRTIAACNKWQQDSTRALSEAPTIPSPPAQATWQQLVAASVRAASDCSAALERRTQSDAKDFRAQLTLVNRDEGRLVGELKGTG